jgi:hypothetical protein
MTVAMTPEDITLLHIAEVITSDPDSLAYARDLHEWMEAAYENGDDADLLKATKAFMGLLEETKEEIAEAIQTLGPLAVDGPSSMRH